MPKEKIQKIQAQTEQDFEKIILRWDTALYTQYQKTKLWYLVAGLISGSIIAFSFLNGAWSFGISLTAICIAYLLLNAKEIPHAEVIISPKGIKFGEKKFLYKSIDYFWIEEQLPSFQALHLEFKDKKHNEVIIQFYDFTADHLSNVLRRFIPQDPDKQPGILEHIIHILKL